MKKKTLLFVAVTAMLVLGGSAIVTSCRKSEKTVTTVKKPNTQDYTGVTVDANGIPHYTSVEAFQAIYDGLTTDFMNAGNSSQAAFGIGEEGMSDAQYDQGMSLQVAQYIDAPFTTFENNIGLSSMRADENSKISVWLSNQGDSTNLDSTNYPSVAPVGRVMKAMINADGNFAIADSLYHIESDLLNFKVVGTSNISTLQEIMANQVTIRQDPQAYIANKGGFGIHVSVTNYGGANTEDCKVNRTNRVLVNVDDRNKYYAINSFYYDFVKSSSVLEVDAYYWSRVLGWIPAATKLRAGINVWSYDHDCGDQHSIWTGENNFWGNKDFAQTNWWGSRRQTKKAVWNADGQWGCSRVKDLSYQTWSTLNL